MTASRLVRLSRRAVCFNACIFLSTLTVGCASYSPVEEPRAALEIFGSEADNRTIRALLATADHEFEMPARLAVSYVDARTASGWSTESSLDGVPPEHIARWEKLTELEQPNGEPVLSDVVFVTPMLLGGGSSNELARARKAAAAMRAPTLLIYSTSRNWSSGYNDAAPLYWTIIGLFTVPGHTIGTYYVHDVLLVDVATGQILESRRVSAQDERHAIASILGATRDSQDRETQAEAEDKLFADAEAFLNKIAREYGAVRVTATP